MKALRIPAAMLTLSALSLLAACGGGGGGGNVTPPTGGGGGQPPATSSPAPTATPTSAPTSTPTPSTTIASNSTIDIGNEGFVPTGATALFNAPGDYSDGGQGSAVSSNPSVNCITGGGMEPTGTYYHMHVYLGFIVNGAQVQVPGGIGMVQPTNSHPGRQAGTVYEDATSCLYTIHTHDESGIIHLEDPSQPQGNNSLYNLQNVFDVWGNGPGNANFPAGNVTIAIGTPSSNVNGDDFVTSYTTTTAAPSSIPLTRHMAIWVIVGPVPATLPQVQWGIQD